MGLGAEDWGNMKSLASPPPADKVLAAKSGLLPEGAAPVSGGEGTPNRLERAAGRLQGVSSVSELPP